MWSTVSNLWKCVTHSRKGTHLKYGVNTTLCREDEFEIAQNQNMNVASGSKGIVLYSEEGENLVAVISSNFNCYYYFYLYYWSN